MENKARDRAIIVYLGNLALLDDFETGAIPADAAEIQELKIWLATH